MKHIVHIDETIYMQNVIKKAITALGQVEVHSYTSEEEWRTHKIEKKHNIDLYLIHFESFLSNLTQIIKELKEKQPNTAIAIISPNKAFYVIALSLKSGADHFIGMPLHILDLQIDLAVLLEIPFPYELFAKCDVTLVEKILKNRLDVENDEKKAFVLEKEEIINLLKQHIHTPHNKKVFKNYLK